MKNFKVSNNELAIEDIVIYAIKYYNLGEDRHVHHTHLSFIHDNSASKEEILETCLHTLKIEHPNAIYSIDTFTIIR